MSNSQKSHYVRNSLFYSIIDIIHYKIFNCGFAVGNDLIMFVRIWQDFFNQKGIAHFRFNTYTISVLVIFFLQMEFKASFPPIETLLTTTAKINSNISDFKTVLRQFFHFYGNRYQIWNHVISINIGQWQERRLQAQKNFSLAKKRLDIFQRGSKV